MANHVHGEVEVEAEGAKHPFRLGINEMIAIQDALGLADDDDQFIHALEQIRGFRKIRTIFYHGLRGSDETMTEEKAGNLMTAIGLARAVEVIVQAMRWAMPGAESAHEQKGGRPRPSRGPTSS